METEPSNEPEAPLDAADGAAEDAAPLLDAEPPADAGLDLAAPHDGEVTALKDGATDADDDGERAAADDGDDAALDDADPDADAAGDGEPAVEPMRLEPIIESMLLASGAPVPLARLVEALDGPDRREVVAALTSLTEGYERDDRGLRVILVGGGYQLRSAPEHGPWVRRLLGGRPPRLSRPMLETLAIVAYRQPCTRPEIEAIRGVDADAVLATLLERRLVRIQGRKEAPGRPLLYATTRDFLEIFGLPDLGALPPLADLGDGAEVLMARDLTVGPDGVHPTEQGAVNDVVAEQRAAEGEPADAPVVDGPDAAPAAVDEDGTRD